MQQRDHLRRLDAVWIKPAIYFLTVCTARRQKILTSPSAAQILTESWRAAPNVHGWVIGRYVIMPDHVHFFAAPQPESKSLSAFMRDWKKWTNRKLCDSTPAKPPLWQAEFFDHVIRSADSYEEKWNYVRSNPVRAGLCAAEKLWPYSGENELLLFHR